MSRKGFEERASVSLCSHPLHDRQRKRLHMIASFKLLLFCGLVVLSLGGTVPKRVDLLERVGSWPGYGRGPVMDLALEGGYAYLALGEGGLQVLDVSNPAGPVRVGS